MYSYGEPVSARFTTVDPIRDGSNWFSYVVNDPVNYLDPFGLTASDSKVNSNNNSSNSSAEVVGIAIENFCNEMAIGFDMATNLDLGFDYSQVATQAWPNGNYLTAAAYEVGASLEVIMDVGIAYYSAGVFGGVVEGVKTLITTGSITRGYIAAEQQINQFTEDFTNSVTKTWNTVSSNISNGWKKLTDNATKLLEMAGNNRNNAINPSNIRFSQSSVNGSVEITESMKNNGWIGDPVDIVEMPDGIYTTVDNTRVLAARNAGIDVKANVHSYNEPLPNEYIDRFTTRNGVPTTWGEAVELRIRNQKSSFRNTNPMGSWNLENPN